MVWRMSDGPARYLIVSASMGAGHDQVALELAARMRAEGAEARVVDLLQVLPGPVGRGLRSGYAEMLRVAPWLYEGIYRAFFVPRERLQPSTSPMVRLAARRLLPVIRDYRPTAVLSTFHLAGQAVGRLRSTGRLHQPGIVVITDAVAHALWLDRGNDLFVCVFPHVAAEAGRRTGRPAIAPGPIIDPRFTAPVDRAEGRRRLELADGEDAVIISTGSWGVGDVAATARRLAALDGVRPTVLCGRNERLRAELSTVEGCLALGWRDDMPELFAGASVLIDNAGGATCVEAFAAGLPVVDFRPIPGHGRAGVLALAEAGLVTYAPDENALVAAVDKLRKPGAERDAQCERAGAIFAAEPAAAIRDWLGDTPAPAEPAEEPSVQRD
jgi:UDP-N-acetylglucosamine:LPS N-acetylglucosamine transferase